MSVSTYSSTSIRPYEESDFDAIVALWRECELLVPWNDAREDIDLAASTEQCALFVAASPEAEGLLGSVMVGLDGHRAWIYYLAVDPEHRGQGLGRNLVAVAEEWAKDHKAPKVQLLVRRNNLDSCSFYAHLGYHMNDCALMQRWLTKRNAPDAPGVEDARLEVTINYLAMTSRPSLAHRPLPQGRKVALMRAERPTIGFYRHLYNEVGKQWLWWERRVLPDSLLEQVIQDDEVEIYVLYVGGVPAGFGELDCREKDVVELVYLGLMPQFVGMGLGRFLLESVIDIAWNHEPQRLLVNTNSLDHPRALSLYQKCGFKPVYQEEVVWIDPRRNGVMDR